MLLINNTTINLSNYKYKNVCNDLKIKRKN